MSERRRRLRPDSGGEVGEGGIAVGLAVWDMKVRKRICRQSAALLLSPMASSALDAVRESVRYLILLGVGRQSM